MSGYYVACPRCAKQLYDDGQLAGELVMCPHCTQQFRMPSLGIAQPPPVPNTSELAIQATSSALPRSKASLTRYQRSKRTTDPFAVACFISGVWGLLMLPIVFVPICVVSGMISYFRLKEDKRLKGHGWRIAGGIFGIISALWLMWQLGAFPDLVVPEFNAVKTSQAYEDGYELGARIGNEDREQGRRELRLSLQEFERASVARYLSEPEFRKRHKIPERRTANYGDFARGYEDGYIEAY